MLLLSPDESPRQARRCAGSPSPRHPALFHGARGRGVIRFTAERAGEEKLLQVASSLTFTTVLAIVPMLAVVLSLFTAFPVFQEFRVARGDF